MSKVNITPPLQRALDYFTANFAVEKTAGEVPPGYAEGTVLVNCGRCYHFSVPRRDEARLGRLGAVWGRCTLCALPAQSTKACTLFEEGDPDVF